MEVEVQGPGKDRRTYKKKRAFKISHPLPQLFENDPRFNLLIENFPQQSPTKNFSLKNKFWRFSVKSSPNWDWHCKTFLTMIGAFVWGL